MRILLPPSEAKSSGGIGAPLDELGFAATALGRHRRRLTRAVARTASGRPRTAAAAFALPPAVAAAAIDANRAVLSSPTTAALDRYRGTVYEALDAGTLDASGRATAQDCVLIFSGLFGVLGAGELVPEYRVPAATVLPRIGVAGSSWRAILARELPPLLGSDVTVDLRSSDYTAMWRPGARDRVIAVRVLSRRPDGRLAVTSYFSKRGKGRLARALIERAAAGAAVRGPADVADLWRDAGLGDVSAVSAAAVDLLTAD